MWEKIRSLIINYKGINKESPFHSSIHTINCIKVDKRIAYDEQESSAIISSAACQHKRTVVRANTGGTTKGSVQR